MIFVVNLLLHMPPTYVGVILYFEFLKNIKIILALVYCIKFRVEIKMILTVAFGKSIVSTEMFISGTSYLHKTETMLMI